MKRIAIRVVPAVALLVAGLAWVMPARVRTRQRDAEHQERRVAALHRRSRGSKYSPLDQINASNFSKIEVAWRFKTDNLGPRPETKLGATPLMVKGMLYATGGHAPGCRRARCDARASRSGSTAWTKASAPRAGPRASFRAAACPTGPTARATNA